MPKEEGAEAIRMRSMWCESDRDECLSISLALALPLEQRPKLSFLTPPSTPSLNSLMTFIILAGIQFDFVPLGFGMERFWCTHTCMPIFPLLLLRLWNTQTRLLGQAVVTFYFPPSTPFFSPPSQSRLISVPSWSQGVCGRVEKPNRVFPQYIRFSYFLSLSLLVVSKQSTDKEQI